VSELSFGVWDQVRTYEIQQKGRAAEVYDDHIRQAKLMDQLGYDYYWIIEHQASYIGSISAPGVYLTAVAANTERIRFGAMIWQLPFHNPMRLAEELAMMDHLSHGRLEFGSGIGTHEHEFIRWGIDYYQRREMGEESLNIIEQAWTQPTVTYKGRYWNYDEMIPIPTPYQDPHPPIWVAAHSLRAFEWAAERNNDVASNISTDEEMVDKFAHYRRIWAECGHPGPMPRQMVVRPVHVAETDAKAREEAEPYIRDYYALGRDLVTNTRIGFGSDARGKGVDNTRYTRANAKIFAQSRQSYDFWVDNGLAVIGSPETVARKIEESQRRIGYNVFVVSHHIGAMPTPLVDKSIELFGKHVIPAFARPASLGIPVSLAKARQDAIIATTRTGPWAADPG
jgi:alkanesulfonate monooxygenase SsuD/methylene tetrahydromethanopterin reductase-like flavin-dependent oxidoreductase (luciferase family)